MKKNEKVKGLVSVVIPTCNRCDLLKRAIDSVLKQTYQKVEVIVVNDGSTDTTKKYLDEIAASNNKVIAFHNYPNKGASVARNIGIQNARGEFFTLLDDDDEFYPQRLEVLLKAFDAKWSFVCSSFLIQGKKGTEIGNKGGKVITLKNVFWKNIMGNSILTYTDRVQSIGGCDPTLTSKIDYDLFVRLIQKYGSALRIKNILLIQHTEHDGLRIGTHPNWYKGQLKFYKKYSEDMSKDQRYFYRYMYQKRLNGQADVCLLLKGFTTLPLTYKYFELGHVIKKWLFKGLSVFQFFSPAKRKE